MRITSKDIAKALIDSVQQDPETSVDTACESALALLKEKCPGVSPRIFLRIVEKEMRKRGLTSAGLLLVPHEKSVSAKHIAELLTAKSGKPVTMERATDPDLIGGAVLLVDHVRIDCSIKGALEDLLKICLQPLT